MNPAVLETWKPSEGIDQFLQWTLSEDCKISSDLFNEVLRVSGLVSKWLSWMHDTAQALHSLEAEYDGIYQRIYDEYKYPRRGNKLRKGAEFSDELSSMGEIKIYVEGHAEVKAAAEIVSKMRDRHNFVAAAVEILREKSKHINNAIRYKELMGGIV